MTKQLIRGPFLVVCISTYFGSGQRAKDSVAVLACHPLAREAYKAALKLKDGHKVISTGSGDEFSESMQWTHEVLALEELNRLLQRGD